MSAFPILTNKVTARGGIRRCAIIGTGAVGSAFAFALVHQGLCREIVLIDRDTRMAEGQMMDLSHCLPWGKPVQLEVGDLDSAADCELVCITAGAAQKPGESRIDLLKRNADIFANFFPRLSQANPGALFVIITNPVDIMARLALEMSGLHPEQVFGTGTTLDTARFRLLLSQHLDLDPRNIHAYVIGEHGDSEVCVWRASSVGPYPLEEYAAKVGKPLTSEVKARIASNVKNAAYQIIERKGATNFAIGVSMQRIFESISQDQSTIQTVSRALDGAYGFKDLCMSIPCIVERTGAGKPMEMPLDRAEFSALMESAEKLETIYQQLKG